MKLRVLAAVLSGAVLIAALLTGVPYAAQDADPYVWMEEIEGAKALDWARAENARSLPQLQKDARFKGLYDDALKILTASDRIPSVSFAGDGTLRDFWQDASHVRGLWRSTTVESYRSGNPQWQTLIDLDALAKNEKANWVWHGPSCLLPEDRLCLVELSNGGKDAASVREFDTRTGMFVKNGFAIPEAKSSYSWLDRDTLLVAHEWKKGELTESGYPFIVKTVKRGEPLSAARELFRGKVKDVAASALVLREPDGRAAGVLIVQSIDFFNSNYYVADLTRSAPQSATNPGVTKLDLPTKSTVQGYVAGRLIVSLEQDWAAAGFKEGDLIDFDLAAIKANPKKLSGCAGAAPHREPGDRAGGDDPRSAGGRALREREGPGGELRSNTERMDADAARSAEGLLHRHRLGVGSRQSTDPDRLELSHTEQPMARRRSRGYAAAAAQSAAAIQRLDARRRAVLGHVQGRHTDPVFRHPAEDLKFDGNAPTLLYAYGGFQVEPDAVVQRNRRQTVAGERRRLCRRQHPRRRRVRPALA